MRDNSNLIVQRFLTLPIIYLNFLLFFRSRVPLITWHGTLLILIWTPMHDARFLNARRSRDLHSRCLLPIWTPTHIVCNSRCVAIMWLTFATCGGYMISFQAQLHNWSHFKLRSLVWNVTKNGYTAWLIVWISTNIGQPCNLGNTILCMGMQGHARPY